MKKLELFFQKTNFERSFVENTIKCAEFEDINELKENYLNYFKEDYPIEDWDLKDFNTEITKINENQDGLILGVNRITTFMLMVKNEQQNKNPLEKLIEQVEIPPMLLCVRYI
jgi:hypothetical protein